jgi:integrase
MSRTQHHQKGYIFRKGGFWYLRYREFVATSDGTIKQAQKCRNLCSAGGPQGTKAAAKRVADEFLRAINDGSIRPENAVTLSAFISDQYLPYVEREKRPSTYCGYRKIFKGYLQRSCERPLRDFHTVDCERLLTSIAQEYDVNRTSLAHIKHFLSGVFRYASRMGVLRMPNPVRDVCLPKARCSGATHAYSLLEIESILGLVPDPARTVIAVAAFTGLRKGELRGLQLADYDGQLIHVERSVWKAHVGDPKGKRGKGAVPVIAPLAERIEAHIRAFGPKLYLFETMNGKPADLDYMTRKVIVPTLKIARIQWHGWHAFRRGLATNLHELGVQDIVIQAILRHSDVAVTRESYIKRDGADPRSVAAMKALENELCNHCATVAQDETKEVVVN